MTGQTIAERFCDTINSSARQILQDEAAMFGAQGMVSEQLEANLACEEAKDILLDEDVMAHELSEICDPVWVSTLTIAAHV